MKAKITKRLVDATKAPATGTVKVYDEEIRGFGLVVYNSGKRAFFIEYGPKGARKRMVLGPYGALTVEAAREMAKAKLGDVVKGADPLAERDARRAMPTFSKWRDDYMAEVRRRKKQPRHDERYLSLAAERWGSRPLDSITRRDVKAAMEAMAERGHTTANRWLASVRACFQSAVKDDVIKDNPAMGVEPFREAPPRARVLTDEEFTRVVARFDAIRDPFVRAAFVVLMDTGARKSEVLGARWEDIDLDAGLWRIPSPKAGTPQVVPLADTTVAFLRGVERLGPWLVPGRDSAQPRADLRRAWDDIREAAGVDDVTIHDLRRTFGLHVAKRSGLHIASKLLRHSDIRITERVYAPLGIDDMRAAAAGTLAARGKVIELAKAKAK
ncbi:MAG: tyrosine-type recombinase/integrase [Myxococcota bacterium]